MMDCVDHGLAGDRDGYGITTRRVNGKRCTYVKLHRWVYCEHHGISLSDIEGQVVRHTCDNPRCVNPAHLVLGTPADNVHDMDSRGRRRSVPPIHRGENHPQSKLTESQVAEIKQRYVPYSKTAGGSALAREYGVSQAVVSALVRGETWVS